MSYQTQVNKFINSDEFNRIIINNTMSTIIDNESLWLSITSHDYVISNHFIQYKFNIRLPILYQSEYDFYSGISENDVEKAKHRLINELYKWIN